MKTLYKITLATAMTLSLAGTATALAQTTAVQGHTAYATITQTTTADPHAPATIDGTVACQAPTTERILRALANKPACAHDAYAYAHPHGTLAPWEGDIQWVNETNHQAPDGTLRHAVAITYQIPTEDGVKTLHATATELRPHDRSDQDTHATYHLPTPTMDDDRPPMTVTIGPIPQPTIDGETLGAGT